MRNNQRIKLSRYGKRDEQVHGSTLKYNKRVQSIAFETVESPKKFQGTPDGRFNALTLAGRESKRENAPFTTDVTPLGRDDIKVLLFSEQSKFRLLYIDMVKAQSRMSMFYMDKTRCIKALMTDMVRWVEFSSSPSEVS